MSSQVLGTLLVMLYLCSGLVIIAGQCPPRCSCWVDDITTINCTNGGYDYVPNVYANVLYFDQNLLPNLTSESMSFALTYISMNGNKITRIGDFSLSTQRNLHELHLEGNQIEVIAPLAFRYSEIRVLNLKRNKLHAIPDTVFDTAPSLNVLNLGDNPIKEINFPVPDFEFLELREVILSGCNITSIPNNTFSLFPSNQNSLDISRNKINVLDFLSFRDSNVVTLNLSYNNISIIKNQIYASIGMLDLSYNNIRVIPRLVIEGFSNIKNLNLSGNPLECTCDFQMFCGQVINGAYKGTCFLPLTWKNKSFSEFCNSTIDPCTFKTDGTRPYVLVATTISFAVMIVIIVITIVYKKFCVHKRCHPKPEYEILDGEDKLYDAYLACTDGNYKWVLNHLLPDIDDGDLGDIRFDGDYKLYYNLRDSMPGDSIENNITNNVNKSHKAMFVLDCEYIDKHKCAFEVDYIINAKNRGIIDDFLIIKFRDVTSKQVPKRLRKYIKRCGFIDWDDEEDAIAIFKARIQKWLHVGEGD